MINWEIYNKTSGDVETIKTVVADDGENASLAEKVKAHLNNNRSMIPAYLIATFELGAYCSCLYVSI